MAAHQPRHISPVQRLRASVVSHNWLEFRRKGFSPPARRERRASPQRAVRSEQRSGRRKELRPGGLRRKWPGASLLVSHSPRRGCFLAPRPRPFSAQRNTSQLRDTTLESLTRETCCWQIKFCRQDAQATGRTSRILSDLGLWDVPQRVGNLAKQRASRNVCDRLLRQAVAESKQILLNSNDLDQTPTAVGV